MDRLEEGITSFISGITVVIEIGYTWPGMGERYNNGRI
jgi:hypothetical protein